MVDDDTKRKLLDEIEKSGNVYLSCLKTGIAKATYYRWLKTDKEFRRQAYTALQQGRESLCDIAEHSLLLKVKEKDIGAIKYVLSHNSPRYKPSKQSKVILEHRSYSEKEEAGPGDTLADYMLKMMNENGESTPQ